jgi:ABC-2 type transport system permease protein
VATIATTAPRGTQHQHAVRAAKPGILIPSYSLWQREIVRFYRQRARVIGVIA